MPRTIRVWYANESGRIRKNVDWGITPPMTRKSVVLISASEALRPSENTINIESNALYNLADADVYVTNISPHDGGVEFILHVNWNTPLYVMVDITILDPYEQFFVA